MQPALFHNYFQLVHKNFKLEYGTKTSLDSAWH